MAGRRWNGMGPALAVGWLALCGPALALPPTDRMGADAAQLKFPLTGQFVKMGEQEQDGDLGIGYLRLPNGDGDLTTEGPDQVAVWMPMVFGEGGPKGEPSLAYMAYLMVVDCRGKTAITRVGIAFGATGNELARLNSPDNWDPLTPGSPMTAVWKLVCKGGKPDNPPIDGFAAVRRDAEADIRSRQSEAK